MCLSVLQYLTCTLYKTLYNGVCTCVHACIAIEPPVHWLSQVQLLVSAEDIQNYTLIRKNLERLKLLVEEAELWVQSKPGSGGTPGKGSKVIMRSYMYECLQESERHCWATRKYM